MYPQFMYFSQQETINSIPLINEYLSVSSPLQKYDFSAPNRLLGINISHFSEYQNLSSVKNQH